ncbi:hypothetical protein MMC30_005830 [Trapelia coarctata]|nr:hypothetical protein [Trapelia coarctata]
MSDSASTKEENSRTIPSTQSPSGKRKRDLEQPSSNPKAPKKKRRKRGKHVDDPDIDFERGINGALWRLDGHLLADYLAQKTKQFNDKLGVLELEERRIPAQAIRDTSEWREQRVLENFAGFLDHHASQHKSSKNLSIASKTKGAPHTIVVTASGLRAADLTRSLRTFETKNAIVAKLFAKHIKLADALEYVKRTRIGIGVGTPERLIALLDAGTWDFWTAEKSANGLFLILISAGALSSAKLDRIVVDFSHIDQKKRGIVDMKETQEPLMRLLARKELRDRYGMEDGGLDLLFF